jgi:hypothetical protein
MEKYKAKSAAALAVENEIQRLKAEAYDCIAAINHYQAQLRATEARIVEIVNKKEVENVSKPTGDL